MCVHVYANNIIHIYKYKHIHTYRYAYVRSNSDRMTRFRRAPQESRAIRETILFVFAHRLNYNKAEHRHGEPRACIQLIIIGTGSRIVAGSPTTHTRWHAQHNTNFANTIRITIFLVRVIECYYCIRMIIMFTRSRKPRTR